MTAPGPRLSTNMLALASNIGCLNIIYFEYSYFTIFTYHQDATVPILLGFQSCLNYIFHPEKASRGWNWLKKVIFCTNFKNIEVSKFFGNPSQWN